MRNHMKQFGKMLVDGVAGIVELASLGAAKLCQTNGVVDHGDRLLLRSGLLWLCHGLGRSLALSFILAILQLVVPHQGHTLPTPIEGTLGGGRVSTGAAPEGVLSAGAN